jgi:hypothetical protein
MIPAVLAGLVGGVINAWLFWSGCPPVPLEPDGMARTAIISRSSQRFHGFCAGPATPGGLLGP